MNTSRAPLFVLGAEDPEMVAIQTLLQSAGIAYAWATVDGYRVHPGNAYKAQWMHYESSGSRGPVVHLSDFSGKGHFDRIVLVECQGVGTEASALLVPGQHTVGDHVIEVVSIDHHRPGDPGYGRGPNAFLPASSIGQVLQWLARAGLLPVQGSYKGTPPPIGFIADGTPQEAIDDPFQAGIFLTESRAVAGWTLLLGRPNEGRTPFYMLTEKEVFTAAADHCLEAAYRGRCPGVEPDALMEWRAESRAQFQGRSVDAVLADVEAARAILREAADEGYTLIDEYCGDTDVYYFEGLADLRGRQVAELPEAACREGVPFLSQVKDRDGREKVVLQAASPELVDRFLAGELVPGLTGHYGDRMRGFAGAYLS